MLGMSLCSTTGHSVLMSNGTSVQCSLWEALVIAMGSADACNFGLSTFGAFVIHFATSRGHTQARELIPAPRTIRKSVKYIVSEADRPPAMF